MGKIQTGLLSILFLALLSCQDANELYKGKKVVDADFGDCKTFTRSASADTIGSAFDCIKYEYDPSGKELTIKHINAAFNCCITDVKVEIDVAGKLITITETEKMANGPCKCMCLYDLDYSLKPLESDVYTFKVIEPYLNGTDEVLDFEMDLNKEQEGIVCKSRTAYPWEF